MTAKVAQSTGRISTRRGNKSVESAYELARARYANLGIDTNRALQLLAKIPVSLHCWQGDDLGGFENAGAAPGGGLAVTGQYPGKARTPTELRSDLERALSLIPGRHRVNLHASYAEFEGARVDRDEIGIEHFQQWVAWAKATRVGVDFNPTFFGHPLAESGFTLAHRDKAIRNFWIQHGIRCREIGAAIGKALGTACVTNVWIPDGYKDTPADRYKPRQRLREALNEIFAAPLSPSFNLDAVEPKLFGLGSESYVVGSHEFYLGYAVTHAKLLCLDTGHYHPTESVADKLSAVLEFLPMVLLHISRGVRWDSDHVVTYTDELQALAHEIVRGGALNRVRLGLDYFDASINRVAAWIIGTRNLLRALLTALLEPAITLRRFEAEGDLTARLGMMEELKHFPSGAVWDYYCLQQQVPIGLAWLDDVRRYETEVLAQRA